MKTLENIITEITKGTDFFATMRTEYGNAVEAQRKEFLSWDNAKLDELYGANRWNTKEFSNSTYVKFDTNGFLVDFDKYPKYKAGFEAKVEKMINDYITKETKKLISHITKAFKKSKATAGTVENLLVGTNGIEFKITTDNGKTITGYSTVAGGWNIQREHYRYLVVVG